MKIWLVSYRGDYIREDDVILIVCADDGNGAIMKAKEKYSRKEDKLCEWSAEEIVISDEIVEIYS